MGRLVIFVCHTAISAYRGKAWKNAILGVNSPDFKRSDMSLPSLFNFWLVSSVISCRLLLNDEFFAKFFIWWIFPESTDNSDWMIWLFWDFCWKFWKLLVLILVPWIFMNENLWEVRNWRVNIVSTTFRVYESITKVWSSNHSRLNRLLSLSTLPIRLFRYNI